MTETTTMSTDETPTTIIASGCVEAAIFCDSHGEKQSPRIRISRCYRDGDQWRRSNRLYLNDLPRLRLVCEEAYRELALRRIQPRRPDERVTTNGRPSQAGHPGGAA
ncbi:MAG: hypothetical protein WD534_15080 [Phycisphaeraceae bacterium]